MEEIEVNSWLTLDTLKNASKVVESVGNLQSGHNLSVFCMLEEDLLELAYSDSGANYLRSYESQDEFKEALEQRKEEVGEAPFEEEELNLSEDDEDKKEEEEFDLEDESGSY